MQSFNILSFSNQKLLVWVNITHRHGKQLLKKPVGNKVNICTAATSITVSFK